MKSIFIVLHIKRHEGRIISIAFLLSSLCIPAEHENEVEVEICGLVDFTE